MKQTFLWLLCCWIPLIGFAQDPVLLAKSDSLYAHGVELYKVGKYAEAIPLFTKADRIDKSELDSSSNRRDYSAMWLASCYYKLGDEKLAASVNPDFYVCEPVDRRITVKSDSLFEIGNRYFEKEKYEEALEHFKKCARIEKEVLGENHYWHGNTLRIISSVCVCLNDSIGAKSHIDQYLEISTSFAKLHTPIYANALLAWIDIRMSFQYPSETMELVKERIDEAYNLTIDRDEDLEISSLWYKVLYFYKNNQIGDAINWFNKLLSTCEKYKGVLSDDYYHYADQFASIASIGSMWNEILAIWQKMLNAALTQSEDKEYIAKLRCEISSIKMQTGDYKEALHHAEKAHEFYSLYMEKYAYEFYLSKQFIASCYAELGREEEALKFYQEAANHYSLSTEYQFDYIYVLSSIINLESSLGRYEEAYKHATLLLEQDKIIYGENSLTYVMDCQRIYNILSCLPANIYGEIYNSFGATYLQKTIQYLSTIPQNITLQKLVDENININNIISLICDVSANFIRDIQAKPEEYFQHKNIQETFINMESMILGFLRDDFFKELYNERCKLLDLLVNYCYCYGKYDEALSYQDEILQIKQNLRHKGVAVQIASDYVFATLYSSIWGNHTGYGTNYQQAIREVSDEIRDKFRWMTSYERKMLLSSRELYFYLAQTIAYLNGGESIYSQVAYDAILFSKGLLLNSDIDFQYFLKEKSDKQTLELYDKWLVLKQNINRANSDIGYVEEWKQQADSIEKKLLKRTSLWGDYTAGLNISWKEVQSTLRPNEAAIEFVECDMGPIKSDSIMYAALVLRPNMNQPIFVPLFEKRDLSNIKQSDLYTSAELAKIIWMPLQKILKGTETIYFAPTGELYNIAIESVKHWDNNEIMSEYWNLYRLSSTRQLALARKEPLSNQGVIYGGLQYNTGLTTLLADSQSYEVGNKTEDLALNRNIIDSLKQRGVVNGIDSLPGTRIEAFKIVDILRNAEVNTTLYCGERGTEASFKSLSGKRNSILHIATHGFYWNEREAKAFNYITSHSQVENKTLRDVEEKALSRSGLLFAGVNNVLMGKPLPEGVDDGILTAKEIASLDLRSLDLVVLSACQTGLGEITGDGVFGLQRGFKKAGAKSILMSLWSVDDEATSLLMSIFYNNWIINKKTKHEALELAKQAVRSHKEKGWDNPKYWAAFILLDGTD